MNAKGERRLPRGFHGITALFDIYFGAVNENLAKQLEFDPKDLLVRRALDAFARDLIDSSCRWLPRANAKEIVDAFLPNRTFDRSLFRGLLSEGVLIERAATQQQEFVYFAYERFMDHLLAKRLLDAHLDADTPDSAFAAGGALAFLWDKEQSEAPGLIEALCIQVSERTGRELFLLAPEIVECWGAADSFRQSLVWRATSAFSQSTRQVLNDLNRSDHDFVSYVIGTNRPSENWLPLRLENDAWRSPQERLAQLLSHFSDEEESAWEAYRAADEQWRSLRSEKWFGRVRGNPNSERSPGEDRATSPRAVEHDRDLAKAEEHRTAANATLKESLTSGHAQILDELRSGPNGSYGNIGPPRFDLRLIQRYVLSRVFDLGWTTRRFGEFDRRMMEFYSGRDASKPERVGKKYQWIAYHEIRALVADHFQYREGFREDDSIQAYDGTWQESFRDIDPSCSLRSTPGGTGWGAHSSAWWGPQKYRRWAIPNDPQGWVPDREGLPKINELVEVTCPEDTSRWLNLGGYFRWEMPTPTDREWDEVERRDFWFSFTGYLVRADGAEAFLDWANGVDFWNHWMPSALKLDTMYLGEHEWSPASHYFQQPYYGYKGWTQPPYGCPVKVRALLAEYLREKSGFDCSIDEGFTLQLPGSYLVSESGLLWTGVGSRFVDSTGQIVAFDPTEDAAGPDALLIRLDFIREFLAREHQTICWAVLGEKRVIGPGVGSSRSSYSHRLRMSGAYTLESGGVHGFLKPLQA